MALDTSAEKPAPVRVIAQALTGYVARLGPIWVEGQVAQLTRRPNVGTVFVTLRDPVAEVSVLVTCSRTLFDSLQVPVTEGARVVLHGKFQYYVPRGTLSLVATEIRPVGLGELLARIEQRRQLLAAEGLFDPARKKPLPFLPTTIGLVVGRDTAAEKDVLHNARRRWPEVRFRTEHSAVQGRDAARQVIEAIQALDRDHAVDVIVVARGGGSIEDLLPFSDEGLIRAVAACRTPVVSAIGHESDRPLLDLVADFRASTPTDAAKRVVPDVADEMATVRRQRERLRFVLAERVNRMQHDLDALRSRPALADPTTIVDTRVEAVTALLGRSRRWLRQALEHAGDDLDHCLARVRSLSPLATLERGYAILSTEAGEVVVAPAQVAAGDTLVAQVLGGKIGATVTGVCGDEAEERT